ncbi:MAG: hypothetical protein ACKOZX_15710, partial [Gammaproteobacteria bacterium]
MPTTTPQPAQPLAIHADDFAPLARATLPDALVRPSLSYWQDAWRRLRSNRRAVVSLGIVIGLFLFAFAGPLVWRVDP